MRFISLIFVFICCCASCRKEPFKENFIKMSEYDIPIVNATETEHKIPEEERIGLFDVRIAGNHIIISKEYNDFLIHFIDTKTLNAIKILHVGRGPGEAINSYYIGMSQDRSQIWAKDLGFNKINVFNIDDVVNGNKQPAMTITQDEYRGNEMDIVIANDSIYTSPIMGDATDRFNVYDMTYKYCRSFGEFPDLKGTSGLPEKTYTSVFSGHFVFMPDFDRFAFAHSHTSLISIYSSNGEIISNSWGPESVFPDFEITEENQVGNLRLNPVSWNPPYTMTYLTLRYYDKKLYALYNGTRSKGSKIIVLDNTGIPLNMINIDKTLVRFDIDPEKRCIWGIDSDNSLCSFIY